MRDPCKTFYIHGPVLRTGQPFNSGKQGCMGDGGFPRECQLGGVNSQRLATPASIELESNWSGGVLVQFAFNLRMLNTLASDLIPDHRGFTMRSEARMLDCRLESL